jgi:hypothetical protein
MKKNDFYIYYYLLVLSYNIFTNCYWNNYPDSSAAFEISSNKKGFLPPRIALTATNVASPVVNPAIGLLIFNTATAGGTPNNVSPGYYYWNGLRWYPLVNKGAPRRHAILGRGKMDQYSAWVKRANPYNL